jgi:cytoskeletal protein CcmA (bactofilin family)
LSFIGADVVVSGNVAATSQIHIDGRIDGNVHCDTLVQGTGGVIAGHIVADAAHLAGLVDGTVKARLVTLEASARVTGDVAYETLSIAAGAAIEGRLTRKEAAPAAVEAPLAPVELGKPEPAKPKIAKAARSAVKAEEPGLLAAAAAPPPLAAAAG